MRLLVPLFLFCAAAPAQSSREMADLNWMEFREVAPAKVQTVLLPTGTVEAHGVANNCADVTAPVAPARAMASKVNALVAPAAPYGVTGSLDPYAAAESPLAKRPSALTWAMCWRGSPGTASAISS
jgi:creatinine amidohydrolase